MFLDLFRSRQDKRNVRLFGLSERRRHANNNCVALFQIGKVGGCSQPARVYGLFNQRFINIADIGLAGVNPLSFSFINFEPDDLESVASKLSRQRQADVAQPNYSYARTLVLNQIDDFVFDHEQFQSKEYKS